MAGVHDDSSGDHIELLVVSHRRCSIFAINVVVVRCLMFALARCYCYHCSEINVALATSISYSVVVVVVCIDIAFFLFLAISVTMIHSINTHKKLVSTHTKYVINCK